MAATQLDSNNFQPNASIGSPTITNVQVTNSSYTVLDDTAVSTSGGFIKITGTKFNSGVQVYIGTTLATSIALVSSTVLNVQVPATVAGSYDITVVNTDGTYCVKPIGITFSPVGITWVTSSILGSYLTGVAISLQLSATGAAGYQLQSGSTLPTGLTLSSGGLLSGTVNVGSNTTYSFTIEAYDSEFQDAPRTFSLSVVLAIPPSSVEYLAVAGAGGGGSYCGGGGGAGGLLTGNTSVTTSVTYSIVIGAGGAGSVASNTARGSNGVNTTAFGLTAVGGGGGTSYSSSPAGTGGSGGGGSGTVATGATGTAGQGFAGGNGSTSASFYGGGGGGGAGAVGANGSGSAAGNGGNGLSSSITGTATFYAGGGGGSTYQGGIVGLGGAGGGGRGGISNTNTAGSPGGTNTGGGGGAASFASSYAAGGTGGSGVVIIRYSDIFTEATSTTGSPVYTVVDGFRIYRFTGSGSITF